MFRYLVGMRPLLELPAAVVVGQWPALLAAWMLCWRVFALLHPPLSRLQLPPLPLYPLHRQQSLLPRRLQRHPSQHPLHGPLLPAWHCPRLPLALLSFALRSWRLGAEPEGQFLIVVWPTRSTRFHLSAVGPRSAGSSGTQTCRYSWQGKIRHRIGLQG